MPRRYSNRSFRWRPRRRTGRKRRFRRKHTLTARVRKLETAVERKFIDTVTLTEVEPVEDTVLWPTLGPTATIVNLVPQANPPTVPVSDESRIGDKVTLTSIQVDYKLTPQSYLGPATDAVPNLLGDPISTLVRFMLVWFPGVGPLSTIIENVIEAPNTALSFYKRNGPVNYKILCDHSHHFTYRRYTPADVTGGVTPTYQPIQGAKTVRKIIPLDHASYYDGLPNRPVKGTLVWFLFQEPEGITVAAPTDNPTMCEAQVFTRLTFDDS